MAQWTIGSASGDTCVAQNADGRLEVFARAYDDSAHLWHIWQMEPNGVWSDWASLGRV
jgi:hypothetical protein